MQRESSDIGYAPARQTVAFPSFILGFTASIMGFLSTVSLSSHFLLPVYALGAYWAAWIVYALFFHPLAKVPGPWLAKVSRAWYMIQIYRGDMEKTQRRLHAKYGPLLRIAPNEVAVADPSAIKLIYRNQGGLDKTDFYPVWNSENFSKHKDMFTVISDKTHGERRRIISHVYSLSNVLKSEAYLDKCTELFLGHLREHTEGKVDGLQEPIDFGTWLHMFANDIIGELYFGKAFGFLEKGYDHGGWMYSLELLMPFLCMCAVAPSFVRPVILASSLAVPGALKALKALENIATSARAGVSQRFDETGSQLEAQEKRTDLLQQLYDIHLEKGSKVDFNMGDVEQEAYVALFAGADTTTIGFKSVFYHLMKNPTIYKAVQEEIDAAAAAGQLSSPIKYSEAIKLPLLCAAVKEALRIHPGVQLSMGRVVPAGGMELCGTYIPGGYWVGMNPAVVHRNKSVFGEDADEFRPARWLEANADAVNMDKHLLTFGAGTRVCIGKNISLAEMHKLVPEVLRHFDVKLEDRGSTWKTKNLWFCSQEMGPVRVSRR